MSLLNISKFLEDNRVDTKTVYSTTIIKMLLCKTMVDVFLKSTIEMENFNSNTVADLMKKKDSEDYILSNKDKYFFELLSKKKFYILKNLLPKECVDAGIDGIYTSGKLMVAYNVKTKLLFIMTYTPLSYVIDVLRETSDSKIRELKCYVYDNISKENFDKYVTDKTDNNNTLDLNTINTVKSDVITSFYSLDRTKLIKLTYSNGMYVWDIINRYDNNSIFSSNNDNDDTVV